MEDENSLREALKVIQDYKKVSGLELNLNKTQGLNIADAPISSELAGTIKWVRSVQVLGIRFEVPEQEERNWELNFEPALRKMRGICEAWRSRHLSLKGKVVILNTLILPVIYYPCTMLPVEQKVISETEKLITNFI